MDSYIAQCNAGDKSACGKAGMILSDPKSPDFDAFLSLRYLQNGCNNFDGASCGRLALIYFDGAGDVDKDWSAAGNFSQRGCAEQDRDGCDVAEAVFADSGSPYFDAEKALRYRGINCGFGRWQSCMHQARILYNLGDYRNAEQLAAHTCGSGGEDRKSICELAGSLKSRRVKMERAEAAQRARQQAARQAAQANKRAIVTSFLKSGDYDGAIYAAIYNSRTVDDAEYALTAAINAGAMGSIYIDNLHVLDYWFPSGSLNRGINTEISRRSRGSDCGIFNCTNMPGASSSRWAAQNGGGRNSYRRSSSSGSSASPSVLSSADARRQVREKYRSAHCTMNNNANRNVC
ncbi:sel1 repeat family protein [Sphingopyxis sp. BSNA05]|uniref:sel1 repeat family protein n=1 Tax=Sphingopyxis sp. BSNA05 TaxID=1236614 RepID=UPI0020B76485|nr:sel1 repeat family protein [Sphingopyxis sp. BSNA05]